MNKKNILAVSCLILFASQTIAASYTFSSRKEALVAANTPPVNPALFTVGVDITPAKTAWVIDTKDINIANSLSKWATIAGYKLIWDIPMHVLIDAPDSITDTFENALEKVLNSAGVALGDQSLEACFYRNTPQLIRITRKGEQKECQ